MMAMTTSNSMSVKPLREQVPLFAKAEFSRYEQTILLTKQNKNKRETTSTLFGANSIG